MEREEYNAICNYLNYPNMYPPHWSEDQKSEFHECFRNDQEQLFYVDFEADQSTPRRRAVVLGENDATENVFVECHLAAGYTFHRDMNATLREIRKKYYWLNCEQDVEKKIMMCEYCQRGKGFRYGLPELRCEKGQTYSIPDSYILIDYSRLSFGQKPVQLFDVQKAYTNLGRFVEEIKTQAPNPRFTQEASSMLSHTDLNPTDDDYIVSIEKNAIENLSVRGCRVYAPPHIPLLQHVSYNQRIVFTPSYQRHHCASLDQTCKDTIFVLVVNASDAWGYFKRWGNVRPILVLPEEIVGIGSVRYTILCIAQAWNLPRCWVVDDSIIADSLRQIERKRNAFNVVEQTLKNLTFEQMFFELEVEMDQHDDLCLIGPTSLFSIWDNRYNSFKLKASTEFQTAHRAPTSIVLINVSLCKYKGFQYVKGLFSKEDILFAYSCLITTECLTTGCYISVHRKYCYKDDPFQEGGAIASHLDVLPKGTD